MRPWGSISHAVSRGMSDMSTGRNVMVISAEIGVRELSAPSPRSCGERVGVRGPQAQTRGETPSPGMSAKDALIPTSPRKRGEVSAFYRGNGMPCERPRFCISKMFILKPLPMIMSPGFWSAAQGPIHLAAIVMVMLPPGRASLWDVTVIV